jgi:hypothetical protein
LLRSQGLKNQKAFQVMPLIHVQYKHSKITKTYYGGWHNWGQFKEFETWQMYKKQKSKRKIPPFLLHGYSDYDMTQLKDDDILQKGMKIIITRTPAHNYKTKTYTISTDGLDHKTFS